MRLVTAVILCLLLAACVAPQAPTVPSAEVRQAIEQANVRFAEAFNRGDAEAVAAFYTENAQASPPNAARQRGREAIRAGFSQDMAQMAVKDLVLTTGEVEVYANDVAAESGTYSLTMTPSGGTQTQDRGKYVVIWKKQADGAWKLHWDIWNSDLPPPEPPAPK